MIRGALRLYPTKAISYLDISSMRMCPSSHLRMHEHSCTMVLLCFALRLLCDDPMIANSGSHLPYSHSHIQISMSLEAYHAKLLILTCHKVYTHSLKQWVVLHFSTIYGDMSLSMPVRSLMMGRCRYCITARAH